jgi:hypothetical protein
MSLNGAAKRRSGGVMPRRRGDDPRVSQRCDLGKNGDTFAVDRGEAIGEFCKSGIGLRHLGFRK